MEMRGNCVLFSFVSICLCSLALSLSEQQNPCSLQHTILYSGDKLTSAFASFILRNYSDLRF